MNKTLLQVLAGVCAFTFTQAKEKTPVQKWAFDKPFEQKVFIENKGQYEITEHHVPSGAIAFGARQEGSEFYFAKNSIWVMHLTQLRRTEKEIEKLKEKYNIKEEGNGDKEEKELVWKFEKQYHQMEFIGANPSPEFVTQNEVSHYYNFTAHNKNIKAQAYQKITYKNLYPGIDMEVIFPEDKSGFKYTFILQPGANPEVIKIKYPLNEGISLSGEGNIEIKSIFGNFTDHAPIASESGSGKPVDCSFELTKKGIVQFNTPGYDLSKGLIIDPWTSVPVFAGGNNAYDVDWDNAGNCYAYGGTSPFQVIKFNPAGGMIWTFTTSFSGATYYGDFAVDRNTGSIYITDGFNFSGAQAQKVNQSGALVTTYGGNSLFAEMWRISFSRCTNAAVIAGGGTSNPSYTGCYLDTALINMTPVNILNSPTGLHDMWGLTLDAFGNAYFCSAKTQIGSPGFDNIIYKVPIPALTPITWQTPENYNFVEVASVNYAPGPPNGFNGTTMSNVNLYTYDSYILEKWNSATGALITSVNVNGASLSNMTWGGLTSDDCDNIFLGSSNTIRQYNSALALVGTIAAPGNVYDVMLGKNNILYSCGAGFVMATQLNLLPCSIINVTNNIVNAGCATLGSATVTPTGGTAPYTITWNSAPVQNGPVLSNVPTGTYVATIIDNSCIKQTKLDTIVITSTGGGPPVTVNSATVCNGSPATLTAAGATNYTWMPGNSNATSITVTPATTTIYTLTGNSGGCSTTITSTVTVNPLPIVTITSGTICVGQQTTTLTATGANTYTWNPMTGLTVLTASTVSANPAATTVYTVSGTNANGCISSGTSTVTVNPLPIVTATSTSVCPTSSGTITASGANTYTWNTGATTASISAAPAVTTVYTVTGTNANGCFASSTATITINPNLAVTASSNSPLCTGATLNFTTPIGVSWAWSGPNGFTSIVQNPSINNVTIAAAGNYSLTATDINGCFGSVVIPVTINPLPVVTVNSGTICAGQQTANLTATGANTYSWTPAAGLSATNVASVNANPTVTTNYIVTGTSAAGCVNTATATVVVNPLPVVTVNTGFICNGGSANLNATGANTYSWNPGTGLSSTNTANTIATLTITTNYTVTGTDVNGCVSSAPTAVTVVNNPTVTVNTSTICVGQQTATLTANGAVTYAWTPNIGLSSTTGTSVNANPPTTTVYTITGSVGTCTAIGTTTVSVNPLPVVTVNSGTICIGQQTANLTANGASTYSWTPASGLSATSGTSVTANPTITTNYIITGTDVNGCKSTGTSSVLVNALPIVTTTGSTICANQPLTVSAGGGVTYVWTGPLGFTANSAIAVVSNAATAGMAGTYIVTVTDANGCIKANVAQVIVNPLPAVTATSNTFCIGNSGVLTAGGAVNYNWSPPVGLSSTVGGTVTANGTSSSVYTVTGTDINGCVNTVTTSITVNPLPTVTIAPASTSGCAPLCVNFSNISGSSGSCSWTFGDGTTSTSCTPIHCFTVQGLYKETLTLTDGNGCVNTSTATVNVYPVPIADFNATPQPTNIFDPNIHFYDATTGATITSWYWTFGNPSGNTASLQNPSFNYNNSGPGEYPVYLYVTSDHGCKDSTLKIIKIDPDWMIYVPNAFTPNGDGTNEFFFAKGEGIKEFKMYIFDRWGNLIFYSYDINQGWDGRIIAKGGDIVQEDVYVWKIELKNFKGDPHQLSGHVSLVK